MSTAVARFVDLTERMIYLRSIPVAALLPPPVLKVIASYLRECSFPAGSLVMREGEPIEGLQLLTEGRLSLVRKGKPFGALSPPQSLGFLGILARDVGTYDATAELDTRSLELKTDALLELLEDHVELLHATMRYLAERDVYEIMELPPDVLEQRFLCEGADRPIKKLSFVERLVDLRGRRIFARTNLNALTSLAKQMSEFHFAPGERVWSEGDGADFTLLVLAGTGRCCVAADERRWRVGGNVGLGGLETIAERPRWYTLEAETPLAGFRVPAAAFLDVAEDDFSMASEFISMLARDLIALLERRALLGQSSVGVMRNVSNLGAVKVGA